MVDVWCLLKEKSVRRDSDYVKRDLTANWFVCPSSTTNCEPRAYANFHLCGLGFLSTVEMTVFEIEIIHDFVCAVSQGQL